MWLAFSVQEIFEKSLAVELEVNQRA